MWGVLEEVKGRREGGRKERERKWLSRPLGCSVSLSPPKFTLKAAILNLQPPFIQPRSCNQPIYSRSVTLGPTGSEDRRRRSLVWVLNTTLQMFERLRLKHRWALSVSLLHCCFIKTHENEPLMWTVSWEHTDLDYLLYITAQSTNCCVELYTSNKCETKLSNYFFTNNRLQSSHNLAVCGIKKDFFHPLKFITVNQWFLFISALYCIFKPQIYYLIIYSLWPNIPPYFLPERIKSQWDYHSTWRSGIQTLLCLLNGSMLLANSAIKYSFHAFISHLSLKGFANLVSLGSNYFYLRGGERLHQLDVKHVGFQGWCGTVGYRVSTSSQAAL